MSIEFSGFDWDKGNQEKSFKRHGVSQEEAEETFFGNSFVYPDERHSTGGERRYVLFGESKREGRCLFIAFTMRGKKVRIISARPMSQKERSWYEEEKKKIAI